MQTAEPETIAIGLVTRIETGDRDAESELIDTYQRGLKFILLRQCNQDEALASDMVQDTWSVVLEALRHKKLRDPAKLSSFIIQTGKNLVIAHFRKAENKKTRFIEPEALESLDDQEMPEISLERYNLSLLVKQVILELEQKRDRELMFRLYVKEQEKAAICQALELDTTHFDRVLYRAKQRFKTLWQTRFDTS